MNTKVTCSLFLAISILMGCRANVHRAPASTPLAEHDHGNAPAAVHGMVLFGTEQLYASHIPMFAVPHDWQALFKVELSHPTKDAKAVYLAALQGGTQKLVTLKPKPFILPKLLSGEISSFTATMHKGNFEDGGAVLLAGITVKVAKIMYQQHLSTETLGLSELTYLSLGLNDVPFLIHKITAPDNFDQIVQLKWRGPESTSENIDTPVVLENLTDAIGSKLKLGQSYSAVNEDGIWKATLVESQESAPEGSGFEVISAFYCTPGPEFFGLCP